MRHAPLLTIININPIDAKAPGLKKPSKVLKKFLLCVVRMAKKPLSVVRGIKKVMVFPSKSIFGLAKKTNKKPSPTGAPTPLLSTPGASECYAVPQGTKCGANRAHGRVRELGLEKGRGKDPGPGPKAEQRLSRCMALTQKQQISD
jgi:hypothetical protein